MIDLHSEEYEMARALHEAGGVAGGQVHVAATHRAAIQAAVDDLYTTLHVRCLGIADEPTRFAKVLEVVHEKVPMRAAHSMLAIALHDALAAGG